MDNILKYIKKQKEEKNKPNVINNYTKSKTTKQENYEIDKKIIIFGVEDALSALDDICSLAHEHFEEAKGNEDYTTLKALECYLMWDDIYEIYYTLVNDISELTPIENLFYAYIHQMARIKKKKIFVIPQAIIENYRVDFLVSYKDLDNPKNALVIECDGFEYHSTKKQMAADNKRERRIRELGYDVIRFSGTEIYNDVRMCVNETFKRLDSKNKEKIC